MLKVKNLPQGCCVHIGRGKAQKEKERDDDKCRGICLEWSSCDGITMAQILLTSIITFSSSVHICQHHKPSTSPCSLHHVYPPATVPTHHLPTSLHPSSTSVCSSLQNVMRQRSRRKHGSGVLRGRGLLPTGKIVLIKKNLLSKCFGGVLAGWHGHWVDGWVNRL